MVHWGPLCNRVPNHNNDFPFVSFQISIKKNVELLEGQDGHVKSLQESDNSNSLPLS